MLRIADLLPERGPARILVYATLPYSIGRGLFVTASVVFFLESVDLSEHEVAAGMTGAAIIGLLAGVPGGHLADRLGPRPVAVGAGAVSGTALLGYTLIDDVFGFLAVAAVVSACHTTSSAARGALVAGLVPPEQRVRTRALLRSVTAVGWTAGAPLAGIALYWDTRAGYLSLICVTAAVTVTSAAVFCALPSVPSTPKRDRGPRLAVLADRPYLTLAALNSVLSIHFGVFNVIIPIWVVTSTEAPAWIVAGVAVVNTVMVTCFQVRASRGSNTVSGAAGAQRTAGFLLLGGCLLYGLSAGVPAWVAVALLLAGSFVHVIGELLQSAGGWGLSFDLAPDGAHGQYQGLYNMGFNVAEITAPVLGTAVVVGLGLGGWLLIGAAFTAAGLLVPMAARWAQRTRTRAPHAVPAPAA